jgi:hypothetical protein
MKNARQLLEEFIATSFRDPKQAASMFTADGTFEMPYLEDLGFEPIYRGQNEISAIFQFVRDLYPGFEFENLQILIDTPDQYLRNTSSPPFPVRPDDGSTNYFSAGSSPKAAKLSACERPLILPQQFEVFFLKVCPGFQPELLCLTRCEKANADRPIWRSRHARGAAWSEVVDQQFT